MMDFSPTQLRQLASGTLTPGEVYRMLLTPKEGVKPKNEGDVSRNKYFIVMGVAPDGSMIGFVLINSEINERIPQLIKDSHYKILASDYPFLQRDRYVCCGELKEIDATTFFERFRDSKVGTISDDHLEIVRGMIAMSANVSAKVLQDYNII